MIKKRVNHKSILTSIVPVFSLAPQSKLLSTEWGRELYRKKSSAGIVFLPAYGLLEVEILHYYTNLILLRISSKQIHTGSSE